MKKLFLFLMMLFACNVLHAQSIISDEVTSDGLRMVIGETVAARDLKDKQVFFCWTVCSAKRFYRDMDVISEGDRMGGLSHQ